MSATTTPQTFGDLYSSLLNRMRVTLGTATPSTSNLAYAKSYINESLHDLHIGQNWWWAERPGLLLTHDTYSTGSVSIASTSRTTLEGNSTLWNTSVSGMGYNNLRVGGKLQAGSEGEIYLVSAVASDTSATLDSRYVGGQTTATAYALAHSSYTYYEDEYALASDFWRLVDVRFFSSEWNIPILPRQEFRRRYPRNNTPGKPQVATIIELGPSGSVALRPRVVLHPYPDAVYQIPYRYITVNLAVSSAGVGAENLSADADEPIVPLRYRHVLVPYAATKWFRYLKDDERAQAADAEYVDLFRRMANDAEPERDRPVIRPKRAAYWAGTTGPGRKMRGFYTTGSEFDELRDRSG